MAYKHEKHEEYKHRYGGLGCPECEKEATKKEVLKWAEDQRRRKEQAQSELDKSQRNLSETQKELDAIESFFIRTVKRLINPY